MFLQNSVRISGLFSARFWNFGNIQVLKFLRNLTRSLICTGIRIRDQSQLETFCACKLPPLGIQNEFLIFKCFYPLENIFVVQKRSRKWISTCSVLEVGVFNQVYLPGVHFLDPLKFSNTLSDTLKFSIQKYLGLSLFENKCHPVTWRVCLLKMLISYRERPLSGFRFWKIKLNQAWIIRPGLLENGYLFVYDSQ